MIVSTDDAARRQEFIWLGPPNSPWPFEARGKAWVVAVLLTPPAALAVSAPISAATGLALHGPGQYLVTALLALTLGIALAVAATRAIGRRMTPTRPLAHLAATLGATLTSPRPEPPTTHTTTAAGLLDADLDRREHTLAAASLTQETTR